MAVLVEAISVLVRCDAIHENYPGGWVKFVLDVPNGTLCSDNEIARIGFMTPQDAEAYIKGLERHGLLFIENSKAVDIAVADQQRGLSNQCDWLEFGRVKFGISEANIACCRLVGSKDMQIFTPDGWKYEGSLSNTFGFSAAETAETDMRFLRHEKGLDVYFDALSGKEVFVGRTGE